MKRNIVVRHNQNYDVQGEFLWFETTMSNNTHF